MELLPVGQLVADPGVEVIVHAGRQDFELFYKRYAMVPANVFDVQLAAGFAGYGASLPYGRLVGNLTGIQISKGESYTDWCRRPLTEAQVHYAADDVRYLVPAARRLGRELRELGRDEWAREELRLQYEDESSYRFEPNDAWRRVSGRGALRPRALAILREVASWREQTAYDRDVPRGWILKDPTLIEVARRAPTTTGQLKGIRGFNAREADRSGSGVLAAVARGRGASEIEMAPAPPKAALSRARLLSGLADALVRTRCEEARIAPELVTNRNELEALLADVVSGNPDDSRHRLLRGWRRDLAGAAVLALVEGRIALKSTEHAPYIEEVPLGN
jgi:ribonuclease D